MEHRRALSLRLALLLCLLSVTLLVASLVWSLRHQAERVRIRKRQYFTPFPSPGLQRPPPRLFGTHRSTPARLTAPWPIQRSVSALSRPHKQSPTGSKGCDRAPGDRIDVVTSAPAERDFPGAVALVHSVLSSATHPENLCMHVIVSKDNEARLRNWIADYLPSTHVQFHSTFNTSLLPQGLKPQRHAQILLADAFPELEKVLYIDPATIIRGDVTLFVKHFVLTGSWVPVAFLEPGDRLLEISRWLDVDHPAFKRRFGSRYPFHIFEPGLMVVNLRRWRAANLTAHLAKYVQLNDLDPQHPLFTSTVKDSHGALLMEFLGSPFERLPRELVALIDTSPGGTTLRRLWVEHAMIVRWMGSGGRPWLVDGGPFEDLWREYELPELFGASPQKKVDLRKEAELWDVDDGLLIRQDIEGFAAMELEGLLEQAANQRRQVMTAYVSRNYLTMFKNFVDHVQKAGIHNLLVVVFDHASLVTVRRMGLSVLPSLDSNVERFGGSDEYQSDAFYRVLQLRFEIMVAILRLGYHVLQSDLDIVWLRNPFPHLWGDYEMEVQVDARVGFAETDPYAGFNPFVNGGVHYSLGLDKVADLFMELKNFKDEQVGLNTLLKENKHGIRYRMMEPCLFPNGFTYFYQRLPQRLGIVPFMVHGNWVNGLQTKIYRFREANMWTQDPPEYFDTTTRRYMAYDDGIPNNGLNNMRQALRSALAIARILDRTLILPAFHMFHLLSDEVDMSFFFDMDALFKHFPNVREHSFLAKQFPGPPKLLARILDPGASQEDSTDFTPNTVTFRAQHGFLGATDREIRTWLEPYKDEPLLMFGRMFRRFYRFEDEKTNSAFNHDIDQGLVPAPSIRNIAAHVSNTISPYNCLHLRRRDFAQVHKETEKQLRDVARATAKLLSSDIPLYIASDEADHPETIRAFAPYFNKVQRLSEVFPYWHIRHFQDPELGWDQAYAFIDQLVCANGREFVGNFWSTFTLHICLLREKRGIDPPCEDIYERDLPEGMPFV